MAAPNATATPLRVLALVCTLKPSPAPSSTAQIAEQLLAPMRRDGAVCDQVRCVDANLLPGVETDMGEGDEWPALHRQIEQADIVVFATPTWLGQMSSVAKRVLERLDAALSETEDDHRPVMVGKVAVVAVVGNEDGAHAIVADAFQALNDIGFTIPAQGCTYWNGEAMQAVDFADLDHTPETVTRTAGNAARNAVHLAALLREHRYPPYPAG